MNTLRIFSLVSALGILVALAPTAEAQQAAAPTQPAEPALKGPTIAEHPAARKPSTAAGFGPDSIEKKKQGGKPTPPLSMAEFLKSLDVLHAGSAPEAAHLTPEQSSKIQTIASDFELSTKSYMDKNKAEIDTLRNQLTPTDRNMLDQQLARGGPLKLSKAGFGGKKRVAKQKGAAQQPASPDTSPSTSTSATAATARTRLVEIYSARPKSEDAQAKILGALSPSQLSLVEAQLAQRDAATQGGAKRKHAPKAK